MTVDINPGSEAFVAQLVQEGAYATPEHAVEAALELLRQQPQLEKEQDVQKMNIVELFANSPFRGLDLDLSRDKSPLRDVEW